MFQEREMYLSEWVDDNKEKYVTQSNTFINYEMKEDKKKEQDAAKYVIYDFKKEIQKTIKEICT